MIRVAVHVLNVIAITRGSTCDQVVVKGGHNKAKPLRNLHRL